MSIFAAGSSCFLNRSSTLSKAAAQFRMTICSLSSGKWTRSKVSPRKSTNRRLALLKSTLTISFGGNSSPWKAKRLNKTSRTSPSNRQSTKLVPWKLVFSSLVCPKMQRSKDADLYAVSRISALEKSIPAKRLRFPLSTPPRAAPSSFAPLKLESAMTDDQMRKSCIWQSSKRQFRIEESKIRTDFKLLPVKSKLSHLACRQTADDLISFTI